MTSVMLRTTTRVLHPLMLLVSFFLLLRGHDEPGGGFVAGLVAASAYALHSLANGSRSALSALHVAPRSLIVSGLLLALASAFASAFAGEPPLTGFWLESRLPVVGPIELGTPLLFDIGIYVLVAGSALTVVLALEEG